MHALKLVFKGEHFKKDDYQQLLLLLFALCKLMKSKGMVAVEQHIEKPEDSEIFRQYPHVMHDKMAIKMICDYLRMLTMDLTDPHLLDDIMEKEIEKHLAEEMHGPHAVQTMADGFPALGIVAAVLGIIKTMSHINEPPEVLGKMIGGALVGTFLGVSFPMVSSPLSPAVRAGRSPKTSSSTASSRTCWSHTSKVPPPRSRWRSAAAPSRPTCSPASRTWKKRSRTCRAKALPLHPLVTFAANTGINKEIHARGFHALLFTRFDRFALHCLRANAETAAERLKSRLEQARYEAAGFAPPPSDQLTAKPKMPLQPLMQQTSFK
jgi:flagellar motor component MotA